MTEQTRQQNPVEAQHLHDASLVADTSDLAVTNITTGSVEYTAIPHANGSGDIISLENEASDLAVDLHNFGSVALASEVEASLITGQPVSQSKFAIPPQPRHLQKRIIGTLLGGEGAPAVVLQRADTKKTVNSVNEELSELSLQGPEVAAEYLRAKVAEIRENKLKAEGRKSFNVIMDGAHISPFLKQLKQQAAESKEMSSDDYRWSDWLAGANDEELVNFSQWYSHELKTFLNPKTRAEYIAKQKDVYRHALSAAVEAGWLSKGFAQRAQSGIAQAEIRYFSIFGRYTHDFAGVRQPASQRQSRKRRFGDLIALPTIASELVAVHELGHVASALDREGHEKRFTAAVRDKQFLRDMIQEGYDPKKIETASRKSGRFYEMLNEGYNDHLTMALLHGEPEVIMPSDRKHDAEHGTLGHSKTYTQYREIFGLLVEGKKGRLTFGDIKRLTDSAGHIEDFETFISSRWDDEPVLDKMAQTIMRADIESNSSKVAVIEAVKQYLREARTAQTK